MAFFVHENKYFDTDEHYLIQISPLGKEPILFQRNNGRLNNERVYFLINLFYYSGVSARILELFYLSQNFHTNLL